MLSIRPDSGRSNYITLIYNCDDDPKRLNNSRISISHMNRIKDLYSYVLKVGKISDFRLYVDSHYLPPAESIHILYDHDSVEILPNKSKNLIEVPKPLDDEPLEEDQSATLALEAPSQGTGNGRVLFCGVEPLEDKVISTANMGTCYDLYNYVEQVLQHNKFDLYQNCKYIIKRGSISSLGFFPTIEVRYTDKVLLMDSQAKLDQKEEKELPAGGLANFYKTYKAPIPPFVTRYVEFRGLEEMEGRTITTHHMTHCSDLYEYVNRVLIEDYINVWIDLFKDGIYIGEFEDIKSLGEYAIVDVVPNGRLIGLETKRTSRPLVKDLAAESAKASPTISERSSAEDQPLTIATEQAASTALVIKYQPATSGVKPPRSPSHDFKKVKRRIKFCGVEALEGKELLLDLFGLTCRAIYDHVEEVLKHENFDLYEKDVYIPRNGDIWNLDPSTTVEIRLADENFESRYQEQLKQEAQRKKFPLPFCFAQGPKSPLEILSWLRAKGGIQLPPPTDTTVIIPPLEEICTSWLAVPRPKKSQYVEFMSIKGSLNPYVPSISTTRMKTFSDLYKHVAEFMKEVPDFDLFKDNVYIPRFGDIKTLSDYAFINIVPCESSSNDDYGSKNKRKTSRFRCMPLSPFIDLQPSTSTAETETRRQKQTFRCVEFRCLGELSRKKISIEDMQSANDLYNYVEQDLGHKNFKLLTEKGRHIKASFDLSNFGNFAFVVIELTEPKSAPSMLYQPQSPPEDDPEEKMLKYLSMSVPFKFSPSGMYVTPDFGRFHAFLENVEANIQSETVKLFLNLQFDKEFMDLHQEDPKDEVEPEQSLMEELGVGVPAAPLATESQHLLMMPHPHMTAFLTDKQPYPVPVDSHTLRIGLVKKHKWEKDIIIVSKNKFTEVAAVYFPSYIRALESIGKEAVLTRKHGRTASQPFNILISRLSHDDIRVTSRVPGKRFPKTMILPPTYHNSQDHGPVFATREFTEKEINIDIGTEEFPITILSYCMGLNEKKIFPLNRIEVIGDDYIAAYSTAERKAIDYIIKTIIDTLGVAGQDDYLYFRISLRNEDYSFSSGIITRSAEAHLSNIIFGDTMESRWNFNHTNFPINIDIPPVRGIMGDFLAPELYNINIDCKVHLQQ